MSNISNTRRTLIVIVSVGLGTALSAVILSTRSGPDQFGKEGVSILMTNFVFSLAIILGIGFFFIWKKNKDQKE